MFSLSNLAPPADSESQARLRALAQECESLVKQYEQTTSREEKEELKASILAKKKAILKARAGQASVDY